MWVGIDCDDAYSHNSESTFGRRLMASPLTLLMPVLPGITPQEIFAGMSQYGPQLDAALSRIGTVHFARTLILDPSAPNLQPSPPSTPFVLGIVTEFDGSFDDYIPDFALVVGP